MNQILINSVAKNSLQSRPNVRVGQTVIVHQKIKEGEKERIQKFEGLVIQVKGDKGVNQTFTVRAIISGVGVEKIFPTHAPSIEKIEIVKQSKVRRARLYYMRERSGKSARLREVPTDKAELNKLVDPETIYFGLESQQEAPVVEAQRHQPLAKQLQKHQLLQKLLKKHHKLLLQKLKKKNQNLKNNSSLLHIPNPLS